MLVLALITVISIAGLTASLLQFSAAVTRRQVRSAENKRAFYLAEAGLAEAYGGLVEGKTGQVGTIDAPAVFGEGVFWVDATPTAEGGVLLESTGMYNGGRASVAMTLAPVESSGLARGVFSKEALTVESGSLIDSFDSSAGTYADQVAANMNQGLARVGSNGGITVNAGSGTAQTTILGDVTPGPGESVAVSDPADVTISGSTAPRLEKLELPPVDVPTLPNLGEIRHKDPVPMVLPPGEYAYDGIYVNKSAQLTIRGPATIVLGTLHFANRCELFFDTTDGDVEIFVTDQLNLAAGSLISTSSTDPSAVSFQVTAVQLPTAEQDPLAPEPPVVSIAAKGEFYGTVYAPEANVSLAASMELFGAIAASELSLAAKAKVHFDAALAADAASEAAVGRALAWRVIEIPRAVASRQIDPFRLLGMDPSALPLPGDAHALADVMLDIEYVNMDGSRVNYVGPEEDFDWTTVREVLDGERNGVEVPTTKILAMEAL